MYASYVYAWLDPRVRMCVYICVFTIPWVKLFVLHMLHVHIGSFWEWFTVYMSQRKHSNFLMVVERGTHTVACTYVRVFNVRTASSNISCIVLHVSEVLATLFPCLAGKRYIIPTAS